MLPRLHVVSDDAVLRRPDFAALARRILALGPAVALHLRGHATDARTRWLLAHDLAPAAGAAGAWLVVNDRADLARAAGAQALQLGERSLPVPRARALVRAGLPIGFSAHSPEQAVEAERAGADFLLVGPLFPTASHAGDEAAGPGLIRDVQRVCVLPVIGIGGVTEENMPDVRAAGAHGIAVIRAVWAADDPVAAAVSLLAAMGITAGLD